MSVSNSIGGIPNDTILIVIRITTQIKHEAKCDISDRPFTFHSRTTMYRQSFLHMRQSGWARDRKAIPKHIHVITRHLMGLAGKIFVRETLLKAIAGVIVQKVSPVLDHYRIMGHSLDPSEVAFVRLWLPFSLLVLQWRFVPWRSTKRANFQG